ncbi:MAG: hypothetical protein LBM66_03285 [Bifidobacteriaceae bacterium]|jgi:hypothetical protein|nr:hypothetical protein [Bifidobacteriaceae bacterium]
MTSKIDAADLKKHASALSHLSGEIHSGLSDAMGKSLGAAELESAYHEFETGWKTSVGHARSCAEDMSHAMKDLAEHHTSLEASCVSKAKKLIAKVK